MSLNELLLSRLLIDYQPEQHLFFSTFNTEENPEDLEYVKQLKHCFCYSADKDIFFALAKESLSGSTTVFFWGTSFVKENKQKLKGLTERANSELIKREYIYRISQRRTMKDVKKLLSEEHQLYGEDKSMKLAEHQILGTFLMLAQLKSYGLTLQADETGSGKTVQSLACLRILKEEDDSRLKTIIFCPKSVVNQWISEISKFLGFMKLKVLNTSKINVTEIQIKPDISVVLVPYSVVSRRDNHLLKILSQFVPDLVIVDEAHNFRKTNNFVSSRLREFFQLVAQLKKEKDEKLYTICLSATFMTKDAFDLYNVLRVVQKLNFLEQMKDFITFRSYFFQLVTKSIRIKTKEIYRTIEEYQPFRDTSYLFDILAHTVLVCRTDIKQQVPPQTCILFNVTRADMLQHYKDESFVDAVLAEIPETNKLLETLGDKSVNQASLYKKLESRRTSLALAKLPFVLQYLQKFSKDKVLIFYMTNTVGDEFERLLKRNNINVGRIAGFVRDEARKNIIEDFKKKENHQVLLSQIQILTEGVNLIEATHVIFLEVPFLPHQVIQGMGRVRRFGQVCETFNVMFSFEGSAVDGRQLFSLMKRNRHLAEFSQKLQYDEQPLSRLKS